MTRVAAPAIVVVVAVVAMVAVAARNRSGEPRLVITLSEHELALPSVPLPATGDDPGLQLRIAYQGRHDPLDASNWLPEARLREIGFPFNTPVGAPEAVERYNRTPPRLAWVAFEYDGPAWREIQRRRAMRPPDDPRHSVGPPSRLVPVDAAADFDTLLAKYPRGHLILRAEIALAYVRPEDGGPHLHGTLRRVVPMSVAVPKHLRGVFDEPRQQVAYAATEARYEAEVAIGALGLPYLRSARRIGVKN